MTDLRIGCSGFTYQDWRGNFYPEGLPERKWFEYYCTVFPTVELNVTFYRLPQPTAFDAWYVKSPPSFQFAVKGSRFITHVKRLLDPAGPVKLFFQRTLRLKEKLGVVLWQFPPSFAINIERLERFLEILRRYPVRTALEFRHESWITDDVVGLCREHNAGLCMADWPEFVNDLPVSAGFVYLRRHGAGGSYATRYSHEELERDAARIRKYLRQRHDVYVYFNNDAYGYAPENARELTAMLHGRRKGG
jgi:uncharacterized protein YecE (DUF72 family)